MIFINNQPIIDPEVQYHGQEIPPKNAIADVPVDPNVSYQGRTLPAQRTQPQPIILDPTNLPSSLVIGNIFFPASTQIIPHAQKIIAESQIIDGVTVFEHIARKATEIDFEVLIWSNDMTPVFPQQLVNNIWSNIFLPNTVQDVTNTFLNGIGITQVIIKSINPQPRIGSTNVILKIKALENIPGQTIII